jgi:hypothetical protein
MEVALVKVLTAPVVVALLDLLRERIQRSVEQYISSSL